MYFQSKKDVSSAILFWSPILLIAFIYIFSQENFSLASNGIGYMLIGIFIVLVLLQLWMWLGTKYQIDNDTIKIKSGPFQKTIKIAEVRKLRSTKASFVALNFTAHSANRLEIVYGKQGDIMNVSPKNKEEFIEALVIENSQIQIEESSKEKLR